MSPGWEIVCRYAWGCGIKKISNPWGCAREMVTADIKPCIKDNTFTPGGGGDSHIKLMGMIVGKQPLFCWYDSYLIFIPKEVQILSENLVLSAYFSGLRWLHRVIAQ